MPRGNGSERVQEAQEGSFQYEAKSAMTLLTRNTSKDILIQQSSIAAWQLFTRTFFIKSDYSHTMNIIIIKRQSLVTKIFDLHLIRVFYELIIAVVH